MAIHLTFRQDRCKGCGLCVTACPKHILALESCTDEAACIGCASGAKMCPDSIITIEKD